MKKFNILLIAGLVLLMTCGTALAYKFSASSDGIGQEAPIPYDTSPNGTVPEPATMLLLGGGLVGLVVTARKKMNSKKD